MTARPVPLDAVPRIAYAVMTAQPLAPADLVPTPSAALLRHYGSSEAALLKLQSRLHQRLVTRTAPLAEIASIHRDARIEALRIARDHDGVVIDLTIPRTVDCRPDQVSLAQATQWYVVDYSELATGRLRTVGLASFGLPEIVVERVGERTHAMYSAVLAGLVHRVIAEWPANDPVGPATVTLRDIAYGLGDDQADSTPRDRSIDLAVEYDTGNNLLIVTLDADPATALFA